MKLPAPQDRPTLDAAHRVGWKTWLLQEWGIMLLAAVLAVIVWQITSEKVIEEREIDNVRVELFVAEQDRDRIGAVLKDEPSKVTVTMKCSERARSAVYEALCKTGAGQPVLRLHIGPKVSDVRPLTETVDSWVWPVDNWAQLGLKASIPVGNVYRIQGQQQGSIALPLLTTRTQEVAKAKGIEVRIEKLSKTTFSFLAPEQVVTGGSGGAALLRPDDLDLHEILEAEKVSFDRPMVYDLSFNGWSEAQGAAPGIQDFVRNYRRKLRLPHVQATVILKQIGTLEDQGKGRTQNELIVQLDPKYAWEIDTQDTDGLLHGETWRFAGTLVGPQDLLDQVSQRKSEWNWQFWVDVPEGGLPKVDNMSDKPSEPVEMTGSIHWVTTNPAWRGQGIRFRPTERQRRIPIRVWALK